MVAGKAVSLAEMFGAQFEKGLDGPVRYKLELSAPDGPSTEGGKKALQHIKLVPEGGGPTIVIGSASLTRMAADVRTHAHVAALYAQRFHGAALPVDAARYFELGQALATFFRALSMQVTFSERDGSASGVAAQPRAGLGSPRLLAAVVGVVLGAIIVALAYVLVFQRH